MSAFARAVGDENEYDADLAARSRFKRLFASGAQTTGHLMGLTAAISPSAAPWWGSNSGSLQEPVYADETIDLEWLVISVKQTSRRDGEIIDLRGRLRNERGETAVGAKGRVLVTENI